MLIQKQPPLHLTYSMNVHPGENWEDQRRAIETCAMRVRDRVYPHGEFGLGLRLSAAAAKQLGKPSVLEETREFLRAHGLYAFTINGFPYGQFHGARVKEDVHAPDWRSPERLAYTKQLADILAALLPDGVTGSISTVPGSYAPWIRTDDDRAAMVRHLADCAAHLARIRAEQAKDICLALEPEPGCVLETAADAVRFFERWLPDNQAARRHLGVCLDACHEAVSFSSPERALVELRAAGIRVAKVQLSAALEARTGPGLRDALEPYVEPTYLHQVRIGSDERGWNDIEEALPLLAAEAPGRPARVHFHVPLYWAGSGGLSSTAAVLTPPFWSTLRSGVTEHLEIETYTLGVLPAALRPSRPDESIASEYRWVLDRIAQP